MGEIISVITGQAERSGGDRPGQSAFFGSGVLDHAHGFSMASLSCRIGQRATAVIPPRRNRMVQRSHDRHLYKEHNLVERFFNRIKQFRRIATRYEKLARNYLSFLNLVCTYIWIT